MFSLRSTTRNPESGPRSTGCESAIVTPGPFENWSGTIANGASVALPNVCEYLSDPDIGRSELRGRRGVPPRTVQPIDEYPIGDPDGVPHDLLARLREQAPVAALADGRFFVSRYDDVLDALRRIDEFVGSMRDPGVSVPPDQMLLIEMAEPRHGRIRRFFNAGVSKARVAQLEPWIRSLCDDALDRILASDGPTDLAAAYVRTMPTSVIARLVGASADDHEQIATWVDELSTQ